MVDREKVLRGLECLATDAVPCTECPYCNQGFCPSAVARDAIELLKEQEPRVLTWDEVKQAEVCWMEQRGYEPYAELDAADWNPECYGKAIRCWSAKPTKEQREEMKWDD